MNIFYLHNDPKICAEYHTDSHVVKMILETCQLLSTAHRLHDGVEQTVKSKTNRMVKRWVLNDSRENLLYSATHVNHPSAIWCRSTKENYQWLHSLLVELCAEYTVRYGKIHKCQQIGLVDALKVIPNNLNKEGFTEPTPAMPEQCIDKNSSLNSYRKYYIDNKQHLAKWKVRSVPEWYVVNQ